MKKLINVTQADIDKSVETLTAVHGLEWAPYCPISTAIRRELDLPERDLSQRYAVATFGDKIELRLKPEDRACEFFGQQWSAGRTECPVTTRAKKFIRDFDQAATFDQLNGVVTVDPTKAATVKPFRFWLNCPDTE